LLNLDTILIIFEDSFSPIDLVFYGIAVYEGYKFAFRKIPSSISESTDLTPAYSQLRLPLVIVCFVAISVAGYFLSRGSNGTQTYYHENGSVMSSGELVNGKEEGIWNYYYENGKPQAKASYENGVENGDWVWYFESGELMRKGTFKNGLIDGVWLNYYENGNLSDSSSYHIGRLDGASKSFFENGQISQSGVFSKYPRN